MFRAIDQYLLRAEQVLMENVQIRERHGLHREATVRR